MSKIRNYFVPFYFIYVIAFLGSGCSDNGPRKKSKIEYFKETQGLTMTPHGRILIASVQEITSGKIQYQTEDGKIWRVDMTERADGSFQYGTPHEVK